MLAIDGIEIKLVERFHERNIIQKHYGSHDVTVAVTKGEPLYTPLIWVAFLTGRPAYEVGFTIKVIDEKRREAHHLLYRPGCPTCMLNLRRYYFIIDSIVKELNRSLPKNTAILVVIPHKGIGTWKHHFGSLAYTFPYQRYMWLGRMKKALAYVRVSQEDENPENQIYAIKEWAKRNGIEVVSVFIDHDVSGGIPPRKRHGYMSMIKTAEAMGIKLLLFYDLARLSRSLEDGLIELKQLTDDGFEFKFVAQEFLDYIEDPMLRKKVISDFLWFAELYREDIKRRTKNALERLKKEGKKLGRPPYPFPEKEVKQLLQEGWSKAKIYRYLISTKKICRKTKNGKERCISYERFRKVVKERLGA